jgi:hypothetical protein
MEGMERNECRKVIYMFRDIVFIGIVRCFEVECFVLSPHLIRNENAQDSEMLRDACRVKCHQQV